MSYKRLQRMYAAEGYYWGTEPNGFARLTLSFAPKAGHALDLGAGEGRDAVLFAANGLDVLAVDISGNALEKARKLAGEKSVTLRTEAADLNTFTPHEACDLVYSIGTVQYIALENRKRQFDLLKGHTKPGGIHAIFAFINHPDIPPAPDFEQDESPFEPGELHNYYKGWETLYERSFVFDDDSDGVPHQHGAEEYVFRKLQA